mgnify:CR=1 FL=1
MILGVVVELYKVVAIVSFINIFVYTTKKLIL